MRSHSNLRSAILKEVARYAAAGASVAWSEGPRRTEAIITCRGRSRRVHFSAQPSRHDMTAVMGRVRRALGDVGVPDVETAPVSAGSRRRAREPTSHAKRIAAIEAALAEALGRIEKLERSQPALAA